MLQMFEPAADWKATDRIRRSPAVPVVAAVAIGILLDSTGTIVFSTWWIGTAVALSVTALFRRRFPLATVLLLLLACSGLGGAWHHWRWSCLPENEISAWATDRGRLVRVSAKVLQAPLLLKAVEGSLPWQAHERTVTLVECRELRDTTRTIPVAGQLRLFVDGQRTDLAIGDMIEVTGMLKRPAEPANPGEFDSRRWLRSQSLHATLTAALPDAVVIQGRERTLADTLLVLRAVVRRRAEELISNRMRPRTSTVAQSLLLGSRVELDRDLRRAFAESGTLHVLAISGLNVGLLWGWLWVLCRALRLSPCVSLVAVLALLPAYALITDANPPVVRATIVAVVMAFGQLIGRTTSQWNSLALAALLVLAWNPSDLFNAGAQLSFVAVCAILLTTGFLRSVRASFEREDDPVGQKPVWHRGVLWLIRGTVEGCLISVGVWTMTSPLIASQFHLVSPIGFALNVLLSPLIFVMFWLGYSFLLLGLISPNLFGWIGIPFDVTLGWFLSAVEAAARMDLGHNYIPAPPVWWMIGFYILTLSLAVVDQWRGRIFWSARAALAWSVLGLLIALRPTDSPGLSCTVLSVGHGLSILIECPNGRTLLYDAGSMGGGNRAARTIEAAVWSSGRSRLDAILISHADADHCNALPELVDVIPTRTMLAHRTFLDWSQPPVSAAIEHATLTGVGIQLLASGQRIELDPRVTIQVLHPAVDFASSTDNANSVTLLLEYAGRRILLTGDLEREGLYQLLASERIDADILVSPHHGSLGANTKDLARWATPEWLLVSCRDDAVRERLAANFGPETRVLTTARHGALKCRIQTDGGLRIEPFKP
ncbi:MAG: DNA internalization-related competence protein ComEC/Rec2 [Planctomycetes bacterium]|nr:DNA internalization-related competence protein ComEC/Rec2 [Planctomycetota bacterium]